MTDTERFSELLKLPPESMSVQSGVGTLSEKYLHALLKNFFEPDKSCHEVKVGRFTADILHSDNSITEIQTRSLNKLREKLEYYLLEGHKVRVVYPVPHRKWLIWLDPETGETTSKRRSAKVGTIYDSLWELYKIKYFLDWDNFSICLALIDVEDIKNLDGYGPKRKRRATRYDRIPIALHDMITLCSPKDYSVFLPDGLPKTFTSSEFARLAKIPIDTAYTAINILTYLELVNPIGKRGRMKLYEIV